MMDGDQLGDELLAVIEGALGITLEGERRVEATRALGNAIVDHITANAIVTTIVTGGSSAGTYTGTVL